MPTQEHHDTHQKALSINLDPAIFGSFAEIGAGQEVARWFLRVGGASGTVAKTVSAYDKEVSDDLYGTGTRYVSKGRLLAMLDREWEQLLGQLRASRSAHAKFFSFVDTLSARNYEGTNDCHGWVGLRFLQEPGGAPQDVILHVNLRDPSNAQQQEAAGILGVNLLYAAHHALGSAEEFLASVFEELGLDRLEIDCLEWSGSAFESWDRNEVHVSLVTGGYAEAVVFRADDQRVPPNEVLYKRALVLAPDTFTTVDQLHANWIQDTLAQLPEADLTESKGGLGLFCLSIASASADGKGALVKQIVAHTRALRGRGYGVMVFRAPELYKMSAYVNRYTKLRINFATELAVVVRVMEDRYQDLPGALLEGIARLFTQNVRLIVYPMMAEELERRTKATGLAGWRWKERDGMVSADNLHPSAPLGFLYHYLLGSGLILPRASSYFPSQKD
jgi:hypothetical protein